MPAPEVVAAFGDAVLRGAVGARCRDAGRRRCSKRCARSATAWLPVLRARKLRRERSDRSTCSTWFAISKRGDTLFVTVKLPKDRLRGGFDRVRLRRRRMAGARDLRPVRRDASRIIPDLRRLLMPDDYVGHPLRKSFAMDTPWGYRPPTAAKGRRERGAIEVVEREFGELALNMGPQHPSTHGVLRLGPAPVRRDRREAVPSSATCTGASRSCRASGLRPAGTRLRARRLPGPDGQLPRVRARGRALGRDRGPAPRPVAARLRRRVAARRHRTSSGSEPWGSTWAARWAAARRSTCTASASARRSSIFSRS